MRIALIALYVVSVLAELFGFLVVGVGCFSKDIKLFVIGLASMIIALSLSEGLKSFCRKSNIRLDAYSKAFEEPPLPGRAYHLFRAIARGYRRLQRVR